MKLSATEVIKAPRDAVWARLTEFDRYESMAKSAAEVTRVVDGDQPEWVAKVEWRGVPRELQVKVMDKVAPDRLLLNGTGSGLEAVGLLTLAETSASTTSLTVDIDLRGKSLGGKAILQGLKVARGTVQEKFAGRVKNIAKKMSKGLA